MKDDPAKRRKEQEAVNARLKQSVADLTINKLTLLEIAERESLGKILNPARWRQAGAEVKRHAVTI